MRKYLLAVLLLPLGLSAQSPTLSLVARIWTGADLHPSGDTTGGSDCWGWTSPDGVDYAIFGTFYGTHYVRASDGAVLDSVPGATQSDYYYHRDIKTWRNYAFIVGEMTGPHEGMQVVDLSYLPDSVHLVTEYAYGIGIWNRAPRSHNLSIDTATGFAYVNSPTYSGTRIIDIRDPAHPADSGYVTTGDIHDNYARNDTLWVAEGYQSAFSIWDVRNKSNPVMIGRITDPNFGYCHQIWPTDDGKYFVTCEETQTKTIKLWDMRNVGNITQTGQYLSTCGLAHNAHIKGDSMYISHYEDGFVVVDISNKAHPVEVAHYDTYPAGGGSDFYGCWGAFPFTRNGYMYASSIEGWMNILRFDSTATSTGGVPQPTVSRISPNPSNGRFTLSPDPAATRSVTVYATDGRVLHAVTLSPGESFTWDASGRPAGMYLMQVQNGPHSTSHRLVKTD